MFLIAFFRATARMAGVPGRFSDSLRARLHFHLVLFVRHAPKVAGSSRNIVGILNDNFEILHFKLPCEEHALVALALGF